MARAIVRISLEGVCDREGSTRARNPLNASLRAAGFSNTDSATFSFDGPMDRAVAPLPDVIRHATEGGFLRSMFIYVDTPPGSPD